MISLPIDQMLQDHRKSKKDTLMSVYSNSNELIAKSEAITADEFSANYPVENFEFYTEAQVEAFKSDFNKSEDFDAEFLKSEIDSLTKVSVQGEGDSIINFYVKVKEVAGE